MAGLVRSRGSVRGTNCFIEGTSKKNKVRKAGYEAPHQAQEGISSSLVVEGVRDLRYCLLSRLNSHLLGNSRKPRCLPEGQGVELWEERLCLLFPGGGVGGGN